MDTESAAAAGEPPHKRQKTSKDRPGVGKGDKRRYDDEYPDMEVSQDENGNKIWVCTTCLYSRKPLFTTYYDSNRFRATDTHCYNKHRETLNKNAFQGKRGTPDQKKYMKEHFRDAGAMTSDPGDLEPLMSDDEGSGAHQSAEGASATGASVAAATSLAPGFDADNINQEGLDNFAFLLCSEDANPYSLLPARLVP